RRGDRGGHASGEGISAGHVETELNPCFVIDEVGSRVAAAPSGERNGQLRHGERTKAAIAERQKFSALLKMLRAGLTWTPALCGLPHHGRRAARHVLSWSKLEALEGPPNP